MFTRLRLILPMGMRRLRMRRTRAARMRMLTVTRGMRMVTDIQRLELVLDITATVAMDIVAGMDTDTVVDTDIAGATRAVTGVDMPDTRVADL